jgi:hypothetical protein
MDICVLNLLGANWQWGEVGFLVNLPHCIFTPYRFGRFALKLCGRFSPKQSSVAKLFMMKSAELCDADGVQVNWIGFYGSPRADRKHYGGRLHMFMRTPFFDF